MKKLFSLIVLALAFAHQTFAAQTFYVFKVTALIPVVTEHRTQPFGRYARTLKTNDVVNLALGRPLGTKVDAKTEVLGLATNFESKSTNTPISKLIVFNPNATGGDNPVKAVVATLSNLDWDSLYAGKTNFGQGLGEGQFLATVEGDPSKNGFLQSTFDGSATCSGPSVKYEQGPNGFHPVKATPKGLAYFIGRLKFVLTDETAQTITFDSFVTHGSLKITGNAVGVFVE